MPISPNYPTIAPTLELDFANTQSLDPRITFTRATTGAYYDSKTSVIAEQNLLLQSQSYSLLLWSPYNLFNGTLGSNLVVNGTFTTDTSSWIGARDMTIAQVSGRCEATTSTTARSYFYQPITTVVGQKYRFSATVQAGTYTGSIELSINNVLSTPALGVTNPTVAVTMTGYFTATGTTSTIQLVASSGTTAGLTFYVDDVTLQQQVTAASTAPDNTLTAELITVDTMATPTAFTATATSSYISQATPTNIVNTPTTYSMFVKAGTNNFVALTTYVSAGTFATAVFNLASTGSLGEIRRGGNVTDVSSTITSVGNDWFRCTITSTFPVSVVTSVITSFAPQATGNTFDGSFGVPFNNVAGRTLSIWGAQFEQKNGASTYVLTTTDRITNYIPQLLRAPVNEPRFDFNPVTRQSLGLLMEVQSTNILTWSQDFTNPAWSKVSCTITPAYTISPSGALDAQLITSLDANNRGPFANTTFFTTNTTYTFSGYVKAANSNTVTLAWGNVSGGPTFTFSTASFSTVAGWTTAVQFVGNGWYRLSGTYAFTGATGTGTGLAWQVAGAGNSVIVWGSQIEALGLPTSYIPTTQSAVTRARDNASINGANFSSWYSQGRGTLYVENAVRLSGPANDKSLQLNNGSTANEIWVGCSSTVADSRCQIVAGNVTYFDQAQSSQIVAQQFGKYAVAFETNNAIFCSNNTLGTLDTAVVIPFVNQLTINPPARAGWYKKIAYYPIRVTNTQLQSLTGS
jgi:hypothetical protein